MKTMSSSLPPPPIPPLLMLPLLQVSANIALEAFLIRPSNFLGLSCTALQRPPQSPTWPLPDSHSLKERAEEGEAVVESLLNFKCHTVNSSSSPASQLNKVRHTLINAIRPLLNLLFCSFTRLSAKCTESCPRSRNLIL